MRFTIPFLAFVALSMALVSAAPTDPAMEMRRNFAANVERNQHIAARGIASSPQSFSSKSYDYIVVGAGTAGLALASRLSESGKYSVGVIEAGPAGFGDPIIDVPGSFGADLGTKYDWNYTSQASGGIPSISLPRGHVVGGSSALNFLVWDSASKVEYNAIEELGNPGWNWENFDKYMRKAENFYEPTAADQKKLGMSVQASDYGSSGPVQVTYPAYISEQVQNWVPALKTLGIAVNNQPGGGVTAGASNQPADINPANWTRSYSAPAYYYANSARPNLSLLTDAKVSKVNFSNKESSGCITATGVTFNKGGQSYTVKANKEVIVSGGTFNTPQILELSGIGGEELLKSLGIDVLIDNANVGENMQDHTYSFAAFALKSGHPTLDSLRWNTTFAAEQKALYQAGKPSILQETVPSISYVTLNQLSGSSKAAQLKALAPAAVAANAGSSTAAKVTLAKQLQLLYSNPDDVTYQELIGVDGFFAGYGAPANGINYITFLNANQHLWSRGSVHITKADVNTYPTIATKYYNNQFDRKVSVEGLKKLRKIAAASPYAKYIDSEAVPGANVTSDSDIENFVTQHFATEYHNIGTASMLPKSSGGVVDTDLKVYGTSNLRVVDLSIVPLHISAHTQRTAYGVAEFAAAKILGEA